MRADRDHGGGVDVANLRTVVGCSALTVTAAQAVTASVALRRGRRDYADAVWGPGLAAVAVVGALAGRGDASRRWGLAAVTAGWAARLERQMLGRIGGSDKEDPRYTEFLDGDGTAKVVVKVFVTQGLSQLIVSAPVQLAAASRLPRGGRRFLAPAGLAIMLAGAVIEAVADRQKSRYAALDDDEKPDVLDTGLWGWSRHPNYLGDSLVWDGAWLAAAASAPGALTMPAPIAMSYLLMFATGARRTERRMQDRPGYRDYQRRVAFFVPTTSAAARRSDGGRPQGMADFERSTTVNAPEQAVFAYLSEVSNLPSYFSGMTSARRGDGDEVLTSARLPDGREVQGRAWFRVDANERTIQWGSEGPNSYAGNLEIDGDGERAQVSVRLHTTRVPAGDREVQDGLERTLANIRRLVEERLST